LPCLIQGGAFSFVRPDGFIPRRFAALLSKELVTLARAIAGEGAERERFEIACLIAAAQIDVSRVRRARCDLLSAMPLAPPRSPGRPRSIATSGAPCHAASAQSGDSTQRLRLALQGQNSKLPAPT
jgi:hypothetical protein